MSHGIKSVEGVAWDNSYNFNSSIFAVETERECTVFKRGTHLADIVIDFLYTKMIVGPIKLNKICREYDALLRKFKSSNVSYEVFASVVKLMLKSFQIKFH